MCMYVCMSGYLYPARLKQRSQSRRGLRQTVKSSVLRSPNLLWILRMTCAPAGVCYELTVCLFVCLSALLAVAH